MNRLTIVPVLIALAAPAAADVRTGAAAPNFTLTDASGKAVQLADYKGRTVVLEWNNPGCPFVQKHYNSGNMQKTQAAAKAMGSAPATSASPPVLRRGKNSALTWRTRIRASASRGAGASRA